MPDFIDMQKRTIEDNQNCREQSDLENVWLRPHNYVIKAQILRDNPLLHLPIRKSSAKKQFREYIIKKDYTIERTTKSIIIRLKKWYLKKIEKVKDLEKVKSEITNYLIDRLLEFQAEYGITLDLVNAKIISLEDELKEKNLNRIPEQFRFRFDPHFKKLYKTGVEFTSEFSAINYLKNKVLEDQTPKIADLLELNLNQTKYLSDNIDTHVSAVKDLGDGAKKLSETVEELSKVVQELKPKKSWWYKLLKR